MTEYRYIYPTPSSPMKLRARMYQFDCRDGFTLLVCSQLHISKWEVAVLVLINISSSIKFRIVEMDNWLDLNKHLCWYAIRDPFAFEANP